jgi:hypothetical protein
MLKRKVLLIGTGINGSCITVPAPPIAAPLVSTSGMATTIIPDAVASITDGGVSAAPVEIWRRKPFLVGSGTWRFSAKPPVEKDSGLVFVEEVVAEPVMFSMHELYGRGTGTQFNVELFFGPCSFVSARR